MDKVFPRHTRRYRTLTGIPIPKGTFSILTDIKE
jgi:hypothetical protein